jgi:hypothetical protein
MHSSGRSLGECYCAAATRQGQSLVEDPMSALAVLSSRVPTNFCCKAQRACHAQNGRNQSTARALCIKRGMHARTGIIGTCTGALGTGKPRPVALLQIKLKL